MQRSARVQTYADLKAAVCQNAARFQRSQLTDKPERSLYSSGLALELFYKLPVSERVIYIMDSFASEDLDGEYAEDMLIMLCNPKKPAFPHSPSTAEEKIYTQTIFQIIDGYNQDQIRAFCSGFGNYARFHNNLKIWKDSCLHKVSKK